MGSATLSCNGWFNAALFRKNLTRFWPIWVFYGGVQFFILPMELFTLSPGSDRLTHGVPNAFYTATWAGIIVALGFGCIIAMALFSYLMNPRSVAMYHTLPIRREGLLITNYLSALCFFALPNAVVGLLALLAEARLGTFCPGGVSMWFAAQMFLGMFFFSFAVCCAMFTGHILALPVFYGILNILVFGVSMLTDISMTSLLMGYSTRSAISSTTAVRWLTPVYHLGRMLSEGGEGNRLLFVLFDNYVGCICYCLVGIVLFTCIALLTYQHRQLERAGDVVSVAWARPVFQWGVSLCAGLTGGVVIYQNFFPSSAGPWVFIALATVSALVGAFTARALLKKSLRVLAQGWKSILAPTLAVLLLMGGAHADLFGYQKWVPDAGDVAAVQIYGVHSSPYDDGSYLTEYLSDPELIQAVVDIHAGVVEDLNELWDAEGSPSAHSRYDLEGLEAETTTGLYVYYTLTNGRREGRDYDCVPISAEALADPDSYAARLQALVNRPELMERAFVPTVRAEDHTQFRRMEAVNATLIRVESEDREEATAETASQEALLSYEEANRLWDAALEDIRAGRLRRYLLEDKERMENCYYTDLRFTLNWEARYDDNGPWNSSSTTVTITPQKSATSLLNVLEELGWKDRLMERQTTEGEGVYPSTDVVETLG